MRQYLHYIYIPWLKWLANLTVIMVIFGFVFPNPTNKWLELGMGWTVSMAIAMLFAYWALHKEHLQGKRLALFLVSWVLIMSLMEILTSYYTFWSPFFTILHYQYAVQVLLEILGVLIMVKVQRRQKAYLAMAKGMNLDS